MKQNEAKQSEKFDAKKLSETKRKNWSEISEKLFF